MHCHTPGLQHTAALQGAVGSGLLRYTATLQGGDWSVESFSLLVYCSACVCGWVGGWVRACVRACVCVCVCVCVQLTGHGPHCRPELGCTPSPQPEEVTGRYHKPQWA